MTESILFLLFAICCMMMLLFLFYKCIAHKLSLRVFGITAMIVITILSIGCFYYEKSTLEYCPTCHYEYRVIDDYDYCPRCNTKLTNKCSNCGKTLPDKFFDNATCPYCGAEIKPKVGEQPLSEGSSEQNAEKKNECPECHHSFEGMDYIKDICPFCGKKID